MLIPSCCKHSARCPIASPNFQMARQSPLSQSVIQSRTSTPVSSAIAVLIHADGLRQLSASSGLAKPLVMLVSGSPGSTRNPVGSSTPVPLQVGDLVSADRWSRYRWIGGVGGSFGAQVGALIVGGDFGHRSA